MTINIVIHQTGMPLIFLEADFTDTIFTAVMFFFFYSLEMIWMLLSLASLPTELKFYTCIYHSWSFQLAPSCVSSRPIHL